MNRLFITFNFLILISLSSFSCNENQDSTRDKSENSAEQQKKPELRIPVEVAIVKQKAVRQTVRLTGVFMPIRSVDIISETSGKVQKVNKNLGDQVSTKDTLAKIDSRIPFSQYNQAKAEVLSANNNLSIAHLNLASDKELFTNGDISKLEYESSLLAVKTAHANHLSARAKLNSAEKMFMDTRIISPITGVVSRKYIEVGTMATNGMALYRIVNLSTLKIGVGVSQKMINLISVGSSAEITISAMNNFSVSGKVHFISPQADEKTGTFLVEIEVINPNNKIKAGMTAGVDLTVSNYNKQIVIPVHALINKNENKAVYKIEKTKARLVKIVVNQVIGPNVIIDSGIAEGDSIVVVGMKNLGVNTPVLIETVHE